MRFQGLTSLLPKEAVLLSEESRRVYECDGLSAYRRMPGCVVLPEDIEQARAIAIVTLKSTRSLGRSHS